MKLELTQEEKAHCYAFIGGLSHVPMINRHTRRNLVRIAKKFAINQEGPVTLTQTSLQHFLTLIDNAVINGVRALNNPKTTDEQKTQIKLVNQVFEGVLKKSLGKSTKGVIHISEVLGTPEIMQPSDAVSTEIPDEKLAKLNTAPVEGELVHE